MAALLARRVFGPRILSFVTATPAIPVVPRAALPSPRPRLYRRRWVELRRTAAIVLIEGCELLLGFWWVAALAFWLVIALAVGICALAAL